MNKLSDNKSLHSIINMDFVEGEIDREFIAKAFFLPKEILCSSKWKIETIRVCSGEEWKSAKKWLMSSGAHICYDPNSEAIIDAAKNLGVSIRKHTISGETFVVVKLWYGEASHQLFAPRKTVVVKGSTKEKIAAYDRPTESTEAS